MRSVLLPIPTPVEFLERRVAPVVALAPEDMEALGVVRGVSVLLARVLPPGLPAGPPDTATLTRMMRVLAELPALIRELGPGES